MNDELRIGHGWDVHAFGGDRPLLLGGVPVKHDRGLRAHSDGDVLLHAVTDALLGATALGDIGEHFPDDDPQFEGIDSGEILRHVRALVGDAGWRVVNADVTVIAEAPRLHPHKEEIQRSIAELLRVEPTRVGLKAKTAERLGPVGRHEGVEVHAVVLLARERVGAT